MQVNFTKNFLFATLILVFFLNVNGNITYAKEYSEDNLNSTPQTEEQQSTPAAIINYDLAYPGVLPDHPLYKLKVLRDRISLALISDPMKKIDFYLLQADKGILASAMLIDKNKIDLAKQTALKAEHNYTLLAQILYSQRKKPDADFFKKLKTASLKHQEVLDSFAKRVSKDDQKTFLQVIDFSKRNWETIEKYQKAKLFVLPNN
ncbi:MAG: hypothetical protein HYT07_02310 [Candidatus Levybacteria bacterium]|nr:hypothetical protein [Candidatus Levybacteria bacterium]